MKSVSAASRMRDFVSPVWRLVVRVVIDVSLCRLSPAQTIDSNWNLKRAFFFRIRMQSVIGQEVSVDKPL
jgi:hypothetical protein